MVRDVEYVACVEAKCERHLRLDSPPEPGTAILGKEL
jgi:hypothetical protein